MLFKDTSDNYWLSDHLDCVFGLCLLDHPLDFLPPVLRIPNFISTRFFGITVSELRFFTTHFMDYFLLLPLVLGNYLS